MAALTPDEKCRVCLDKKTVLLLTNAAGCHPELVMPTSTDGASLSQNSCEGIEPLLKTVKVEQLDVLMSSGMKRPFVV